MPPPPGLLPPLLLPGPACPVARSARLLAILAARARLRPRRLRSHQTDNAPLVALLRPDPVVLLAHDLVLSTVPGDTGGRHVSTVARPTGVERAVVALALVSVGHAQNIGGMVAVDVGGT